MRSEARESFRGPTSIARFGPGLATLDLAVSRKKVRQYDQGDRDFQFGELKEFSFAFPKFMI
ncbi:hypothetical protein [Bradyrhizobium sp. ORS 375]|uniref:hypothetical protein n=1 Tax=Bradyrhizobium sp. (strain ORS 375) TaxID=566679 RepID=UPI001112B406|nr:hypothetical protein [Bradyrhizobium sp. ORS 375]